MIVLLLALILIVLLCGSAGGQRVVKGFFGVVAALLGLVVVVAIGMVCISIYMDTKQAPKPVVAMPPGNATTFDGHLVD